MSKLEPDIISVKELLQKQNLKIPTYQRPYKWTTKNVTQLINDIIFHREKSAYRLGTLVIHREGEGEKETLNIVDGQQRTLTLTLIAYAITQNCREELKKAYQKEPHLQEYIPSTLNIPCGNDISKANIQKNYREIERRMKEFDSEIIHFFFEKCQLVTVVLSKISEAFQFFDSQNARGKDLEPHDLLKAFHLREMNSYSTEEERKQTVEDWETMQTEDLSKLFAIYLYRIKNWNKGYSARYFTKNDVDIFKGISPDIQEDYPFAQIYRIAHHYTDHYNQSAHRYIHRNQLDYPFQIDQNIINGKRFFQMVAYYHQLIKEVKSESTKKLELEQKDYSIMNIIKDYPGCNRTGDKYIRNLFYCALIYYIDKFGTKELPKAIDKLFIWAYTLRLKLINVGLDSVDNYALNRGGYSQIQLFQKIRESIRPTEITGIQLETLKENRSTKTEKIVEHFKHLKYYE